MTVHAVSVDFSAIENAHSAAGRNNRDRIEFIRAGHLQQRARNLPCFVSRIVSYYYIKSWSNAGGTPAGQRRLLSATVAGPGTPGISGAYKPTWPRGTGETYRIRRQEFMQHRGRFVKREIHYVTVLASLPSSRIRRFKCSFVVPGNANIVQIVRFSVLY